MAALSPMKLHQYSSLQPSRSNTQQVKEAPSTPSPLYLPAPSRPPSPLLLAPSPPTSSVCLPHLLSPASPPSHGRCSDKKGALATAMADAKLIRLKLLVDKDSNRVVFAESQKDFVDVLLGFLTLPVGTIVRLLNKQSPLGCMDMLYESVEKLDLRFMETQACKTMLLHPRSAAEAACEDLTLNIDEARPRCIYRCKTWDCYAKISRLYSPVEDAKCPCGLIMDEKIILEKKDATKRDGVFVTGEGSFSISDNLHVVPTSTDATLALLRRFGVNNGTVLEAVQVKIGKEEMLQLLRRSVLSDTPLTEAFLRTVDINGGAEKPERDELQTIAKCGTATGTDKKKLKMKLVLSDSRNAVLYAEAGGDVVDLLFSFLTFPVGSIVKLLDKCSCVGCLDNLYKSTGELVHYPGGRLVDSDECTTKLLSPKLAPMFGCSSQLLGIQEEVFQPRETFGCRDCYNQRIEITGTKCRHGTDHGVVRAVNPESPSSETGSGGGFTKGLQVYMITDELKVTPLSSVSSSLIISRSEIPVGDLVVREVSLGQPEALKLLKASLISKRALSTVFCHKKQEKPLALN